MPPEINSNDFGFFFEINKLVDSNSIFVAVDFFEGFELLVCSKFNHTQCGRTRPVLWSVCAHRIPIRTCP